MSETISRIYLKEGREAPARLHHPWIFSGAIEKQEGNPAEAPIVQVVDSKGEFVAWGQYSPASQIRVRLLEWNDQVVVNDEWYYQRLAQAIDRRQKLIDDTEVNAYRLVYAEADLLPGLIVDRYDEFLVLQTLTLGMDRIKHKLAQILDELLHPQGIYERNDVDMRTLEGLPHSKTCLLGTTPPLLVKIKEGGYQFLVDIKEGQKTGFYLDQRENRNLVAKYAAGKKVLDCFCYTGGFSVYALGAGAQSVTRIDASGTVMALAEENLKLNGFPLQAEESVVGNAFQVLRNFRGQRRQFDLVILDPPKFAPSQRQMKKALRAYKDINLQALKLLPPGGILVTFSCSGLIDFRLFQSILTWAATDAGREVQILQRLSQASDHPLRLAFPESEYLKGFICRVL
ncbi:MAG: class I SAM-dependent rRNA methyltransferase [candidate division KSB1 bacterium]|nr:class I SAM-dependent rRNA methyltransferase [candidate division KSB1 bacterium]